MNVFMCQLFFRDMTLMKNIKHAENRTEDVSLLTFHTSNKVYISQLQHLYQYHNIIIPNAYLITTAVKLVSLLVNQIK